VVRYLLVAEVVEMFMLAQNKGWFASDLASHFGLGLISEDRVEEVMAFLEEHKAR
jgi:hypothetical protein